MTRDEARAKMIGEVVNSYAGTWKELDDKYNERYGDDCDGDKR